MNRTKKFKIKIPSPILLPPLTRSPPTVPTASKPIVGDTPNPHTIDDPPNPPFSVKTNPHTFPMSLTPPYFQCPNPLAQHHPTIASPTYYTSKSPTYFQVRVAKRNWLQTGKRRGGGRVGKWGWRHHGGVEQQWLRGWGLGWVSEGVGTAFLFRFLFFFFFFNKMTYNCK